MKITNIIIGIFLILLNVVFPFIFNLININQTYYLNYFIWLNALVLLYYILPNKVGEGFL